MINQLMQDVRHKNLLNDLHVSAFLQTPKNTADTTCYSNLCLKFFSEQQ